jgi:hypothetical protein
LEKTISLNHNLKKLFQSVGLLTSEEIEEFELEDDPMNANEFLSSKIEKPTEGSLIEFIMKNKTKKTSTERLDPIVNMYRQHLNEILTTHSIQLDRSFEFKFQFEVLQKFKEELSKYCENV